MIAEGSAASIGGSRRALSHPRLRRLTALSRRSPQPLWQPWLRRSALGRCPGLAVAQDGVEDGEQLAHRRDKGEASRFSGVAQTAVEAFERRVVPDGDKAGHVQRRPDLDTASLDLTLAAISAAVPVHGSDAGQGSDLVATHLPELGQLSDQGAGDDIANAGHAFEEILFSAPHGAGFDQLVDGLVNACPLGLEAFQYGPEGALRDLVASPGQTLLFGIDHDDELTPSRHQFGEPKREVIGHGAGRRMHGLGEVGDHCGIDGIGLGQPTNGAGELAHLARVDDRNRQPASVRAAATTPS